MHGGGVALDATLLDLRRQGVDRIVALGDMVQGGSEPARVLERLVDLAFPVVMGNSDWFVLTGESPHPVSEAAGEVREWTREQLGPDGLRFIEAFTPTIDEELDAGASFLGFHGSPRDRDEVLLPETSDEEWDAALEGRSAAVMAGGHVHLQWMRRIGDALFFNPGSVGLTYNRHVEMNEHWFYPIAEYAVLVCEGPSARVEMCRIPLDVDELQRVARASGRPHADDEARGYVRP